MTNTKILLEQAGYKYAQTENASLAGVYPEPDNPGDLVKDPAWRHGYTRFYEEQDRAL